jgi:hypothetical protein
MADPTSRRRWLIVVRRDQLDLFGNLREAFQGIEEVAVILDRRQTERRQGTDAGAGRPDRRRQQRHRAPAGAEHDLWQSAGLRLIHVAEDLRTYATGDPPATT